MKKTKELPVDEQELEALSKRLEQGRLEPADYALLKALIDTIQVARWLLERNRLSMRRLQRMLFGAGTEKTSQVLPAQPACKERSKESKEKKKRKGHGRRASKDYPGAQRVKVDHQELHAGASCPDCDRGHLYDTNKPGVRVYLVGQAPVRATIYETQKLRCAVCGKLFGAAPPAEAGVEK
jgi:transposase